MRARERQARSELDGVSLPASIVKRGGRTDPFEPQRIAHAIGACFAELGRTPHTPVPELTQRVLNVLSAQRWPPTSEIVRDVVELTLQGAAEFEAARAFVAHRRPASVLHAVER